MAEVNIIAELDRAGIPFSWVGENEVRALCPFHNDTSPSCCINTAKALFKCHVAGCEAQGDFVHYMAKALGTTRAVIYTDLAKRYGLSTGQVVDVQLIERYHQALPGALGLVAELRARGVTDEMIRVHRLGYVDGRVAIPIRDAGGFYVNIRKYLPGAPTKEKMRNLKGRGKPARLYPIEQLSYKVIMVTGGEIKAIVGAAQLNKEGIGCITATCGEERFPRDLLSHFAGKIVYVCLDVDDAGRRGAEMRCAELAEVAEQVYICELPLDRSKHPKGDINDFVAAEGGQLIDVIRAAKKWERKTDTQKADEEPHATNLATAITAEYTGTRISVKAVVAAIDTAPYIVPAKLTPHCDRSQNECALCRIYTKPVGEAIEISSESPAILQMVAASKAGVQEALAEALGIPRKCRVVTFDVHSYYNIEDARVAPQLEVTSRSADRIMQPALCIGKDLDLNESYTMVGRAFPHPRTQQSTLVISQHKPTKDALSTYTCDDPERLKIFQPTDWSPDSLSELQDRLYGDLEANVTRIFQRRDLHATIDLSFHSPLLLTFDGRQVKGWLEALIVGDSAQGKTEATMGLCSHYGLGEKVECKNASVAGLLGGLQQMSGNRWFVSWGIIPTHDRRLVVLEELKGAHPEVIAKLTDMRSSGIAEIPKIEKRRTHARTRLIALSNPRSGLPLSTYTFGIEAIRELVPGLEDIRRFDISLLLSRDDIDPAVLNQLQASRPQIPHTYTGELCRSLILWAWTRTAEQVVFTPEATNLTLKYATELSTEFSDAIPIIDRGSARYKIARCAAALAARTFSTDDMETLLVREAHIEYIVAFLRRVYGSPVFGYKEFSEAMVASTTLVDKDVVVKHIKGLPYPAAFVTQLLRSSRLDVADLQDVTGFDKPEAAQLLSLLVRKHALTRDGRVYRKTPTFIAVLRDLQEHGKLAETNVIPLGSEF